jgi:flagellar basal-body rod protein FlgF
MLPEERDPIVQNPGYIALSRMIAQQRALEVRATNIANTGTPGFKAETVLFSDYLLQQKGVIAPPGGRTVQLVQDRATWRDFGQGQVIKTGNPLDLALQGEGFFAVDTPRGERYTRAGRFSLSSVGQIVDMGGNAVLGTDGRPIVVLPESGTVTVASDGTVSAGIDQIGKFRVVQFDDQQLMQAEGNSLFTTTQPSRDVAVPSVTQGTVEGANIQPIVELTSMMAEMREFEFASQFADGEAQREQSAIDRIGHKG